MQNQQVTVGVIGGGVWGRALSNLARHNGHLVKGWSRSSDRTLVETLKGCDVILSAVSMAGVQPVLDQLKGIEIPHQTILVSATKGVEFKTDHDCPVQTASQFWQATFPDHSVVVLSGPNLSQEIEQGRPAATVVASHTMAAAETIQSLLSSANFRVYTNVDPLGVELGGTLKNIIAIAAGSCDALQLGTNAKAALVTRGLSEMIRIGTRWGANAETFYGLSGLGDLLATCNSSLSRNYQLGYQLGEGKTVAEALTTLRGTAEGINTTRVIVQVTDQWSISAPISHQVHRLIQGEVTPQAAVEALMLRSMKPEQNLLL
ncbi:MAG: NAD(P)H-dependent glycerol-3-phosphate dehydrogenase [Leptolyngbyaceae cyanobacterium bins.59]|nr:NAD(P)H-dependent glycerol-3-phosphate dehydrogenase [Leptolyngbyaceae cyanobacterium bins.59]